MPSIEGFQSITPAGLGYLTRAVLLEAEFVFDGPDASNSQALLPSFKEWILQSREPSDSYAVPEQFKPILLALWSNPSDRADFIVSPAQTLAAIVDGTSHLAAAPDEIIEIIDLDPLKPVPPQNDRPRPVSGEVWSLSCNAYLVKFLDRVLGHAVTIAAQGYEQSAQIQAYADRIAKAYLDPDSPTIELPVLETTSVFQTVANYLDSMDRDLAVRILALDTVYVESSMSRKLAKTRRPSHYRDPFLTPAVPVLAENSLSPFLVRHPEVVAHFDKFDLVAGAGSIQFPKLMGRSLRNPSAPSVLTAETFPDFVKSAGMLIDAIAGYAKSRHIPQRQNFELPGFEDAFFSVEPSAVSAEVHYPDGPEVYTRLGRNGDVSVVKSLDDTSWETTIQVEESDGWNFSGTAFKTSVKKLAEAFDLPVPNDPERALKDFLIPLEAILKGIQYPGEHRGELVASEGGLTLLRLKTGVVHNEDFDQNAQYVAEVEMTSDLKNVAVTLRSPGERFFPLNPWLIQTFERISGMPSADTDGALSQDLKALAREVKASADEIAALIAKEGADRLLSYFDVDFETGLLRVPLVGGDESSIQRGFLNADSLAAFLPVQDFFMSHGQSAGGVPSVQLTSGDKIIYLTPSQASIERGGATGSVSQFVEIDLNDRTVSSDGYTFEGPADFLREFFNDGEDWIEQWDGFLRRSGQFKAGLADEVEKSSKGTEFTFYWKDSQNNHLAHVAIDQSPGVAQKVQLSIFPPDSEVDGPSAPMRLTQPMQRLFRFLLAKSKETPAPALEAVEPPAASVPDIQATAAMDPESRASRVVIQGPWQARNTTESSFLGPRPVNALQMGHSSFTPHIRLPVAPKLAELQPVQRGRRWIRQSANRAPINLASRRLERRRVAARHAMARTRQLQAATRARQFAMAGTRSMVTRGASVYRMAHYLR